MATVTLNDSISTEAAASALRERLPGAKIETKSSDPDTIHVAGNAFAQAKVHVRQTGNGTAFDVRPSAIGPIGMVVSVLWYARRVTRAVEEITPPPSAAT
jgi:hypothetical protein